jgi:hypothetical protein
MIVINSLPLGSMTSWYTPRRVTKTFQPEGTGHFGSKQKLLSDFLH